MLRCATSNSSPCCCRRACSYRLLVLPALELDTNPTRNIRYLPQVGPSSPFSRSAAALSFWCVCRAEKRGSLRPSRCTKGRVEGPVLNCQSRAGRFFHLTDRDARLRPSRMARKPRDVLSTAHVRETRPGTLVRALQPMGFPTMYMTGGRASS